MPLARAHARSLDGGGPDEDQPREEPATSMLAEARRNLVMQRAEARAVEERQKNQLLQDLSPTAMLSVKVSDDEEARRHKSIMKTLWADQEDALKSARAEKMSTATRPLLMTLTERRAMVRELVTSMGADDTSGASAAQELVRVLEAEGSTHVGIEMGVQVVAELMNVMVNGVMKGDDLWRVMNPLGVEVTARVDVKSSANVIGKLQKHYVVKAMGVDGEYLVLPPQTGLGFFRKGYAKILASDGRKQLRRVTDLQSKIPMMLLLVSLTQTRHACLELAKVPHLVEQLADWTTQKGEQKVQDMALICLQRLHTADKLLRVAGDGGRVESVRRALLTRCAPIAPELHAMRTNKSKFPPREIDKAIVRTDDDKGAGSGGLPDKRGPMPDHMEPVPLTYGIGTQSIRNPAPRGFLSLRHHAAPMVLAPPRRPYNSLSSTFPVNSPVCTFDRVRI